MPPAHDTPSRPDDRPAGIDLAEAMDPLSDVLRSVRLEGALLFLVDATSPWCVDVPGAADFAGIILPRARHVVSYHVATAGRGLAWVPGLDPVPFGEGDVIVFPHGDPYVMASAPDAPPELDHAQTLDFFRDLAASRLPFVIPEGGGGTPGARFICGFLGCDLGPCNPVLPALPRLLHIPRRPGAPPDLLDRLVEATIAEARERRAGAQSIRLGLCELMFVEVLRRHLSEGPEGPPSWLTGLRDPVVGRALSLLHAAPQTAWTLAALAREAGTSRSVLSARFAATVGLPPMRYLAMWRLQLAARHLADGTEKVSTVAERVGFGSQAGFSRAFKKATGHSPAQWRTP